MNCFRYSVPLSPELPDAFPDFPGEFGLRPDTAVCCLEILSPLARRMMSPENASPTVRRYASFTHAVLDLLSEDNRVQRSLGEYYGLRLLVTELESAIERFESTGEDTRIRRVAAKLMRELNQLSSTGEPTGFDQTSAAPALAHAVN